MATRTEIGSRSELEAWLIRRIERGSLLGLPLYRAAADPIGRRADAYAQELREALCADASSHAESLAEVDRARAFRNWVERQPRGVERKRPSSGRGGNVGPGSLRRRSEIHRHLEAIAHPDPWAVGFEVPPPRRESPVARLRRLRSAQRSLRHPGDEALVLFVILNTAAAIGASVLATAGWIGMVLDFATVMGILAVVALVGVGFAGVHQARVAMASQRDGGPYETALADATLDGAVGESKGKGIRAR